MPTGFFYAFFDKHPIIHYILIVAGAIDGD
jgi:hypothetical protein